MLDKPRALLDGPMGDEPRPAEIGEFGSDYLSLVSSWMAEAIRQIETALVAGSIQEVLSDPGVFEVIGPTLAERYRKIAGYKVHHDATFRRNWIERFLAVFQSFLREPERRFPARSTLASPFQQLADGHLRPSPIGVRHRDEIVVLRQDQVVSARRWGIWFNFDDELLERAYNEYVVQAAHQELSSNIQSLWNLEATYLSGRSRLERNPGWNFGHRGDFFEHLVIDVLNESAPIARHAPLAEDILERTDLRVTFPSLDRQNGARVQVSITADSMQQTRKIRDWFLPDEIIVLTPVELARKALCHPQSALFEEFPWDIFWESFGTKYANEAIFAQELHQLFVDSFTFATAHPLGAMWLLPKPVRKFIRMFVEAGAIETTRRLREREQSSFKWRGSSEKFTTPYWISKFSKEFSEQQDSEKPATAIPKSSSPSPKPSAS
jgi:hypothetical protein